MICTSFPSSHKDQLPSHTQVTDSVLVLLRTNLSYSAACFLIQYFRSSEGTPSSTTDFKTLFDKGVESLIGTQSAAPSSIEASLSSLVRWHRRPGVAFLGRMTSPIRLQSPSTSKRSRSRESQQSLSLNPILKQQESNHDASVPAFLRQSKAGKL